MPEAEFGFRPSSQWNVPTFAQVVAHITPFQFSTCANLRGVTDGAVSRRN
jgi:hypothetical protein